MINNHTHLIEGGALMRVLCECDSSAFLGGTSFSWAMSERTDLNEAFSQALGSGRPPLSLLERSDSFNE